MIKLLVVDDEVGVCDFVKNFFKERDFEVFVAQDGKEAVSLFESRRPDIILMDLKMPVMNGIDALKEIRNLSNAARVIMVTAIEDIEQIEEAKRIGATEYITKPLLLEQLERIVLTVAEQIKMES